MHSIKQTLIAVGLLGLSFALYHISLHPSDFGLAGSKGVAETMSAQDVRVPPTASTLATSDSFTEDHAEAATPTASPQMPPPFAFQPPKSIDVPPIANSSVNSAKSFSLDRPSKPESSSDLSIDTDGSLRGGAPDSRQAVDSTMDNGVQSIRYPDSEFALPSQRDPGGSGSAGSSADSTRSARDLGLIDALQNQPPGTVNPAPGFQSNDLTASPIASSMMNDSLRSQPASTESSVHTSVPESHRIGATVKNGFTPEELEQLTFQTVWPVVDELVEREDYRTALQVLTRFYRDEKLNGPQRQRLLGWLDALAGKVIFSAEDHLTGQPYEVKPQETLATISQRWQVPVSLIANINGEAFANREIVPEGTRLKEINGPFHAELKLDARVMTLYLNDMYAGRFPVVIGSSGEPRPGKFELMLKEEAGFVWKDLSGREYPPGSPENGYGPHWIGFSGSLCVHSVPEDAADGHRGCIGLSRQDAKDLFSILSETSQLIIVP